MPQRTAIRVLAVSDQVDDVRRPANTADLVVACGDLPGDYLGYLMDALNVPLVFVPGNHDPDLSGYRQSRAGLTMRAGLPARSPMPEGAINADGLVVDVAGLRVAGLGGCLRYGSGPNQYSERQQSRRARALRRRAARMPGGRDVDILITHAPPRGIGDGDDQAHRGFICFHSLVAALRPAFLLHGHVHPEGTTADGGRIGQTVVRNVVGRHLIDIPALPAQEQAGPAGPTRAGHRHAG